MNLANQIRRDMQRLLRRGANSGDVTVVWNAADFSATDPNLEGTYPAPALQSGTWPALVHFVQPTMSMLRQFSEVQVGDAILDFSHDLALPEKPKGAKFYIHGHPKVWVQKSIGKDLADAWDVIIEGQRVTRTYLVTQDGGSGGNGQSIALLTNAEKLALAPSTAVGTKVRVSDGIVVSGAGTASINGFWVHVGSSNGRPIYVRADHPLDLAISWNNSQWTIFDGTATLFVSDDNVAEPWLVTTWINAGGGALPTLTHPVVQQLSAPSSTITAVFISGAGTAEANGIYTQRGVSNGKPTYNLLGQGDAAHVYSVEWETDGGGFWRIYDFDTNGLYQSSDQVAFPWLVTTWADYDPPNHGTVPSASSITQGELDAGVTIAGGGSTELNGVNDANGVYIARGGYQVPGLNYYVKGAGVLVIYGDPTVISWVIRDTDSSLNNYVRSGPTAYFPWLGGAITVEDGIAPAPTITRNDVAAEGNWQVVP